MLDKFEREVRRREKAASALRRMGGGDGDAPTEPTYVRVEQPYQEVR